MKEIIKNLSSRLKDVDYGFVGSFNMNLQGIDINFSDIDILTDDNGIKKIVKTFNSKLIDKEKYLETYLKVDSFPVHIFSIRNNPLRKGDIKKQIVWVQKYGLKLPATDLKGELKVYKAMNRPKDQDKIKKITKFLNKF
jgi:hypothetical protein